MWSNQGFLAGQFGLMSATHLHELSTDDRAKEYRRFDPGIPRAESANELAPAQDLLAHINDNVAGALPDAS